MLAKILNGDSVKLPWKINGLINIPFGMNCFPECRHIYTNRIDCSWWDVCQKQKKLIFPCGWLVKVDSYPGTEMPVRMHEEALNRNTLFLHSKKGTPESFVVWGILTNTSRRHWQTCSACAVHVTAAMYSNIPRGGVRKTPHQKNKNKKKRNSAVLKHILFWRTLSFHPKISQTPGWLCGGHWRMLNCVFSNTMHRRNNMQNNLVCSTSVALQICVGSIRAVQPGFRGLPILSSWVLSCWSCRSARNNAHQVYHMTQLCVDHVTSHGTARLAICLRKRKCGITMVVTVNPTHQHITVVVWIHLCLRAIETQKLPFWCTVDLLLHCDFAHATTEKKQNDVWIPCLFTSTPISFCAEKKRKMAAKPHPSFFFFFKKRPLMLPGATVPKFPSETQHKTEQSTMSMYFRQVQKQLRSEKKREMFAKHVSKLRALALAWYWLCTDLPAHPWNK